MSLKILVTGANRGLGLSMTQCFLQAGHAVLATFRKDRGKLPDLATLYDEKLHLYTCEVTDESSVQSLFSDISTEFGEIDILLNNAAVYLEPAAPPLIGQVDFSIYQATFQANAIAPLLVIKHGLALVRKGNRKLIVNISSEAGAISTAWRKSEFAYCMSKAALNKASKLLQNALAEDGIKVLALHPGWFRSDMGGPEAPMSPEEAAERVVNIILKPHKINGPIYVDLDGKELAW